MAAPPCPASSTAPWSPRSPAKPDKPPKGGPVALTRSGAVEEGLLLLFLLAGFLSLQIWLNRRVNQQSYRFLHLCTGSDQVALLGLFLLYLPGIALHEGTHWCAAWALRMKPQSLSLWPAKTGPRIQLGSVRMQSAGIWRETLVGLAPLAVGTAVIAAIGTRVLGLQDLILLALRGEPGQIWMRFRDSLAAPDGILWLYFVFATGNGMLPSASDRRSLALVMYYLGAGVVLFALVDRISAEVSSAWLSAWLASLIPSLQALNSFLLLVICLNLWLLAWLSFYLFLVRLHRRPRRNARRAT